MAEELSQEYGDKVFKDGSSMTDVDIAIEEQLLKEVKTLQKAYDEWGYITEGDH